jgi:hypothetical protein
MIPTKRIEGFYCCTEHTNALVEARKRAGADLWTPDVMTAWANCEHHLAELRHAG